MSSNIFFNKNYLSENLGFLGACLIASNPICRLKLDTALQEASHLISEILKKIRKDLGSNYIKLFNIFLLVKPITVC